MMFGIHGAEKVGGGFVPGLFLAAAPVQEEAGADPPEHSDDPHGLGQAQAAWVVAVGDVQALGQAARLNSRHWAALNSAGGRLGHPRDGFRGVLAQGGGAAGRLVRRRGSPIASALLAQERRIRSSGWPLLNSRRPARVAVACRGGKTRRRPLDPSPDVRPQGGLVVFDGQQMVGTVFEHQLACGLVLGVEGIEADFAAVQIELPEELARDGFSLVFWSRRALPR